MLMFLAQVPLRILPSKIELLPWGSLTAEVQALPDRGPWTVHESLPPFRLALQAHNITVPFTANEKFLVGVRLFRPVDMLDITVASLEGTTIRQVAFSPQLSADLGRFSALLQDLVPWDSVQQPPPFCLKRFFGSDTPFLHGGFLDPGTVSDPHPKKSVNKRCVGPEKFEKMGGFGLNPKGTGS